MKTNSKNGLQNFGEKKLINFAQGIAENSL